MFDRWAEMVTLAERKYPDVAPGVPNWTLADGPAELQRFKESAFRHFLQWFRDEVDEDHAAAVMFNINGAEHVKLKLKQKKEAA
jgi:phytoene dehydrogenase-like protein